MNNNSAQIHLNIDVEGDDQPQPDSPHVKGNDQPQPYSPRAMSLSLHPIVWLRKKVSAVMFTMVI